MAENQILINALTAAVTDSPRIIVGRLESVGVKASGLAGAETVVIEVSVNGAWVTATTLTATAFTATITASGIYRVTKGSSAGAVTVVAD